MLCTSPHPGNPVRPPVTPRCYVCLSLVGSLNPGQKKNLLNFQDHGHAPTFDHWSIHGILLFDFLLCHCKGQMLLYARTRGGPSHPVQTFSPKPYFILISGDMCRIEFPTMFVNTDWPKSTQPMMRRVLKRVKCYCTPALGCIDGWPAPTAELVHWSVAAHSSFQLDEQQWRYSLSIFSDYNGISHSFHLGWGPILKYKELSFSNLNTEGLSFKYLSDYYGAI